MTDIQKYNPLDTSISKLTTEVLKMPPIKMVTKQAGEQKVATTIMRMIDSTTISLGIDLDPRAKTLITEDIIEKYSHESLQDIALCLKRGRRGEYGTTYNKFNMIIFTEWMNAYLNEKYELREREIEEQKKNVSQIDPQFKEWLSKNANKIKDLSTHEAYRKFLYEPVIKREKLDKERKDREKQRELEIRQERNRILSSKEDRDKYLKKSMKKIDEYRDKYREDQENLIRQHNHKNHD